MSDIDARPTPRTVAFSMIKTIALDEAACRAPEDPNWEIYNGLTAALESWQKDGTLHEDSLLTTEWLAVDFIAYLSLQVGGRSKMQRWLRDFGDQVCQAQQHEHPAGPTAIEILSVVADDPNARPVEHAGSERLARIGVPYLLYLREGHEVQDAREMTLTLALWAGSHLAELMNNEAERITAFMKDRSDER